MIKVPAERIRGNPVNIGESIDLTHLGKIVMDMTELSGLSVNAYKDKAKIGSGLFNKPVDCLVIKNVKKSGYYSIVLTQQYQGNVAFISYYFGGDSSNYKRQVITGNRGGILNAIISPNKRKHQEELMYYDLICDIVNDALEVAVTGYLSDV